MFAREEEEDSKETDEDKKENFVLPWEMKYFSPMLRYPQLASTYLCNYVRRLLI